MLKGALLDEVGNAVDGGVFLVFVGIETGLHVHNNFINLAINSNTANAIIVRIIDNTKENSKYDSKNLTDKIKKTTVAKK